MIATKPIEFPGIGGVAENINLYLEQFLQDGILVFRNANLGYDEQEELQLRMAEAFKWSPGIGYGEIHRYTEDHSSLIDDEFGSDDLMLNWHMEHIYYNNPIVAGLWNMLKFTTSSDNGKTYFYDMRKLYDRLSLDEQTFLSQCKVNVYCYLDNVDKMLDCDVIGKHWYSSQPVIRLPFNRLKDGFHDLKKFGGEEPKAEHKTKFLQIANRIKDIVNNDLDNRIVHSWQQGDIVIPDIYVMAHAVTGGFDLGDRIFTGLWSFKDDNSVFKNLQ